MRHLYYVIAAFFLFSGCQNSSSGDSGDFSPARRCPDSKNFFSEIRNFGDLLRSECDSVAAALNDPILTAVTREFGPSKIPINQLPFKSAVAVANIKPWSSWWFPRREDILFSGGSSSALGKYDVVRKKIYSKENKPTPASATDYERGVYNPAVAAWEGLCDAWAIASIAMPEPKRGVKVSFTLSSVTFNISELKGLLLKTFEGVDEKYLKFYGQKFTGSNSSWVYPDIFPEQFHRFLEVQLFERREPFIMDHDAGVEVWNVPVFKANFIASALPDDPNAVLIKAFVFTVEPSLNNDKDFVGSREAVREYNYVLQGSRDDSGHLTVKSGYWVKSSGGVDSRRDHPDYMMRILEPKNIVRKSWNPEIDIEVVDRILEKSY